MAEFLSEYALALLMVVTLLAGIFSGYPVAFLLGGLGIADAVREGLRGMGSRV